MIIKWGLVCALIFNILDMINDFGGYFSDFGTNFVICSLGGFFIGVVLRKWIFRTFWQ